MGTPDQPPDVPVHGLVREGLRERLVCGRPRYPIRGQRVSALVEMVTCSRCRKALGKALEVK